MLAVRCICLVTKFCFKPRLSGYVVSWAVPVLNVLSVEQTRCKQSARLKGIAFLYGEDGKMNTVDVGVCL